MTVFEERLCESKLLSHVKTFVLPVPLEAGFLPLIVAIFNNFCLWLGWLSCCNKLVCFGTYICLGVIKGPYCRLGSPSLYLERLGVNLLNTRSPFCISEFNLVAVQFHIGISITILAMTLFKKLQRKCFTSSLKFLPHLLCPQLR